ALHWVMQSDAELGQRLSGAIWRFWWLHGHIREGCEQLGAFLSHRKAADKAARLKMLLGAGFLNRLRANFALTRSFAEEALALAQETGDKKSGAFALYQLATLALDDEDFNLAGDLFEKGLLSAKDSGDRQILALLLNGLGELARSRADYAPAGDFYRQALAINREIGDLARQVTNLVNLGATAISQKDLKAAGEFYRDGLQISSKLSDMNGTLYCLEGAAGAFWATRDATRAALLFGAAEALRGANNLFIEPADRLPYDQSVALVRASLTEKVFAELFAKGSKLKLEEAVALGLADWKTNEESTGEALEARAVSVSAPPVVGAENLFATADSDDKQIFGYQPKANRTWQTSVFLGLLLVAALGFGLWFFGNRPLNSAPIQSIAVLPFVNAGGNADMEYLSDGMTESLIASLSQLPKLSVKARSSVFRYKGRENVEPQQVGAELSVQAVLTGRVVQRSDNLLLSIDLTDTKTGNAIWTGQYNRKTTDLVALQSEIARDVSQKLRLRLSGAEEQRVAKSYTTNTEAYQLYLKGRFYWNKRTGEGLKKSVEYFNQAIEQDPNYALAFAGLAESYVIFSGFAVSTPQEAYPKAKAAAKKALEIDETLAEAHAALGLELLAYEWNAAESSREFQRAIELNPNYATARHWYGNQNLLYTGRFDEAIAEMKRAQELDPLSLVINTDLGDTYFYARQYDKAIEQLRKTIEMDESFYYAHYELGMAYEMKGSYAEAIAQYQKARGLNNDPRVLALLGHALAASGKRNEALKTLSELKETAKQHYVPAYNFAIVYAGLKERDQAFEWLEKSYQDRSSRMAILQVDPFLDNLRSDPRLADIISRVGLVK
nr:tetratricopeptide repeat protein [Acidobacteriota bacterium]